MPDAWNYLHLAQRALTFGDSERALAFAMQARSLLRAALPERTGYHSDPQRVAAYKARIAKYLEGYPAGRGENVRILSLEESLEQTIERISETSAQVISTPVDQDQLEQDRVVFKWRPLKGGAAVIFGYIPSVTPSRDWFDHLVIRVSHVSQRTASPEVPQFSLDEAVSHGEPSMRFTVTRPGAVAKLLVLRTPFFQLRGRAVAVSDEHVALFCPQLIRALQSALA